MTVRDFPNVERTVGFQIPEVSSLSAERRKAGDSMKKTFLLILILLLFTASAAGAETAYVTDAMQVTLRVGPGVEYKIIAMPYSGQAVEILQLQEDWSRVRVNTGQEGWILTRHLLRNRLPWSVQVKELSRTNAELKEKVPRLEKEYQTALAREKSLKEDLEKTRGDLDRLQKEYEALKKGATGYLALEKTYREAKARLDQLEREHEALLREHDELASSRQTRWFLTGALVLLCGLLIGVVVGQHQKKRKSVILS